jgi:dipeptidase E
VTDRPRVIVAVGGGGFQMPPDNGRLDRFLLSLVRDRSGLERPRVCFVPTAMADSDATLADFYTAYAPHAEPSHLALFRRTVDDIEAFLLGQDLIFVGGGNTANMLAIWRLHGVDQAMVAAWDAGVVMSGMSAGAICWFEGFTTDSYGPVLRAVRDGLGVLAGSFVPHYHLEPQRRPLFHKLVAEGTLPPGYGVDDGAALVFHDRELAEVVTSFADAGAYRVDLSGGEVREDRLPARELLES